MQRHVDRHAGNGQARLLVGCGGHRFCLATRSDTATSGASARCRRRPARLDAWPTGSDHDRSTGRLPAHPTLPPTGRPPAGTRHMGAIMLKPALATCTLVSTVALLAP